MHGSFFNELIKCSVRNGRSVRFWVDRWIADGRLMDRFPSLFKLEDRKMCLVSDILIRTDMDISIQWSWKKDPESEVELRELEELLEVLRQVSLNKCVDDWRWEGDVNGCFTVAAVRGWLTGSNVESGDLVLEWCKWLPDKCNIFMWRALLDRLPTKTALSRRNIHTDNTLCPLCDDGEETVDHMFTGCGFSMGVWDGILRWCGLPNFFAFSLKDVVVMHTMDGLSPLRKEIIRGVVIACCWRIWKARNERIFDNNRCKVVEIVADVKALTFLWFSNRHKSKERDWKSWCNLYLM